MEKLQDWIIHGIKFTSRPDEARALAKIIYKGQLKGSVGTDPKNRTSRTPQRKQTRTRSKFFKRTKKVSPERAKPRLSNECSIAQKNWVRKVQDRTRLN